MPAAAKSPPSEDKRWRIVTGTMRRYGFSPDALIETLHTVQESFGYLDEDALQFVAENLHVPPSRVYGVATFYTFFNLTPQGEHHCVVCMGTACYIKGAPAILERLHHDFDIAPGETTPDNRVSLTIARCLGACGLGPAATLDGEVARKLDPDTAVAKVLAVVQ